MNKAIHFFPESASETAVDVDRIGLTLAGILIVFSCGIAVAIVVFMARYWHTRQVNRDFGPSRLTHWLVELSWSLGPLAILLAMFTWGAVVYVDQHRPPKDPLQVNVVAKQWMWKIAHSGGRREINTLHVPVGQPVRLTMISEDVIHSFFVPAFRVKQDVLPERYTTLWFRAVKPGTYHLFCAEFCGTKHSQMIGKVVAMQPEAYAKWAASGDSKTLAQRGRERIDTLGCLQCHSMLYGSQSAPSFSGLFGSTVRLKGGGKAVADAAYIRRSILKPASEVHEGFKPNMPSYEGKIEPTAVLEIIAYLRSIADSTGPLPGPGREDRPLGGPAAEADSSAPQPKEPSRGD